VAPVHRKYTLRCISFWLHAVNDRGAYHRPYRPHRGRFVNKIILVADENPVMRDAMCKLFEFEDGLELCRRGWSGCDREGQEVPA
jgi:hypothetical protein